jgi:phosphoribosylanthranilate isomerase
MLVKICGLRSAEHATAAATAGADMLGLVFAPSRRRVSETEAARIVAALRRLPAPRPLVVGLFVNEPPAAINALAARVGLDAIQLSGDEPADVADQLELPLIKAIRMDGSAAEAAWIALVAERSQSPRLPAAQTPLLLVDAHVPGAYGGTGARADWGRAAALAARLPLILAGGLAAASVAAAIGAVRPAGVDVSSGVETDGVKDVAKIEAFLAAARSSL